MRQHRKYRRNSRSPPTRSAYSPARFRRGKPEVGPPADSPTGRTRRTYTRVMDILCRNKSKHFFFFTFDQGLSDSGSNPHSNSKKKKYLLIKPIK